MGNMKKQKAAIKKIKVSVEEKKRRDKKRKEKQKAAIDKIKKGKK
jgi:hypothetical protein